MTARNIVYEYIDTEREYQVERWDEENHSTPRSSSEIEFRKLLNTKNSK